VATHFSLRRNGQKVSRTLLEEEGGVSVVWYLRRGLYPSIFGWGNGLYLAVSGLFIFVAWELVLQWAYKDWRKEKSVKDEKVGWVAKTLKTLASLLVIVLYPIALFVPIIIFLV